MALVPRFLLLFSSYSLISTTVVLESVWTELQALPQVKKVHEAAADLLAKTVQAKDYVQSRLTYIRDMYEGGEPPL